MNQKTIKCPKCGTQIELTKALSEDIEASIKKQYEDKIQKVKEEAEKKIKEKDSELESILSVERKKIEEKAKKAAAESLKLELTDLQEQLREKSEKFDKAQKLELDLRKQQRELKDRERQLVLELERKLDQERDKLIKNISSEIEEKHRLKGAEKDKQLEDMKRQIDDLKRKAELGSQKLKGEVLELDFETRLRNEFPFDVIEPVVSGVRGADILQTVKTQSAQVCGKILWETKRTQNWSYRWIEKLKADQRSAKAEIAVIVSETLPKELTQFRQIRGVWVSDIPSALNLAVALRVTLIQTARERKIQVGKKQKAELVYEYLTGTEFRNRVEAILESFVTLRNDLDKEKMAMEKLWSKREKQIEKVLLNLSGMHGDLEGIAGKALPVVKALELPK
jgi:hypothetical protein